MSDVASSVIAPVEVQDKSYRVSIFPFLGAYVLYTIISTFLFLYSSGGWTGLWYFAVFAFFYFPSIIVSFILSVLAFKRGIRQVSLPVFLMYAILVLQFLVIFFNTGDGGDGGGIYFFWRRFLGLFPYNNSDLDQRIYYSPITQYLSLMLGSYIIALISFLIVYWKNLKKALKVSH